jgi:hypothetical protein
MSSFFFEKLGSPLNALILKDIINLFLMAEFQFLHSILNSARNQARLITQLIRR